MIWKAQKKQPARPRMGKLSANWQSFRVWITRLPINRTQDFGAGLPRSAACAFEATRAQPAQASRQQTEVHLHHDVTPATKAVQPNVHAAINQPLEGAWRR
jgi:hypothetical protein